MITLHDPLEPTGTTARGRVAGRHHSRPSACDRIRSQGKALQIMSAAIAKGAEAGLEPLMWQLGASGCSGSVSTFGLSLREQEQLLRDWAAVLDLEVRRVETSRGSVRWIGQDKPAQEWMPSRIMVEVELCDWDAE